VIQVLKLLKIITVVVPRSYCLIMTNGWQTCSNPAFTTQSPEPDASSKLSTLHSCHSNTGSSKILVSKSRAKAPPKIGPKSKVPQKLHSINRPETSSESESEDVDPPATLKGHKSCAKIGTKSTAPQEQEESSVSWGAGSDTQSCDDDATQQLSCLVVEIDSRLTRYSNQNLHVSAGQQGAPCQSSMSVSCQHRDWSQSIQVHGLSPPALSSPTSHPPRVLCSRSPPPPSFSLPPSTTQTSLDYTHNVDQVEPDHVDDDEGVHLGGWFTAKQVAWAQNRCVKFLADLDAKAKEWK
jgi:hypothetical protein